jgi:uncharacterized membrane protein HdeD (DUF308 family)
MLLFLAANWRALLFRAVMALAFGGLALFWPRPTLATLAVLFGAYALVDGIAALIVAVRARGLPALCSLLLGAGLIRTGAGVIALAYPGLTSIELAKLIAGWAAASGVVEIAAAAALRTELSGAWPLPVAGALSIAAGAALMLNAGMGALSLDWLIGVYAVFFGLLLLAFALRLQELAAEIAGG